VIFLPLEPQQKRFIVNASNVPTWYQEPRLGNEKLKLEARMEEVFRRCSQNCGSLSGKVNFSPYSKNLWEHLNFWLFRSDIQLSMTIILG
jgi:hypothetical protein